MRKPGSTIIDDKGKSKPSPDSRKPLAGHKDVEAKRAAQAAKPEVTHAISEK